MTKHFGDRLVAAVKENGPLCVGIDPQMDKMPMRLRDQFRHHCFAHPYGREGAVLAAFGKEIVDAVAPYAAAVKPNTGFFECYGAAGFEALEATNAYAKDNGLIVINDAKRGDGGDTAKAYAQAHIGAIRNINLDLVSSTIRADAVTVDPYIGDACAEPFVAAAKGNGAGAFFVVKTSFAPNSRIEQIVTKTNMRVWQTVAQEVARWGKGTEGVSGYRSIGAVLGATYPEDAPTMRRLLPNAWFLVPGYGAQGGGADDAVKGANPDGLGVLVNSSRGVIYAPDPAEAARQARDALLAALEQAGKPLR